MHGVVMDKQRMCYIKTNRDFAFCFPIRSHASLNRRIKHISRRIAFPKENEIPAYFFILLLKQIFKDRHTGNQRFKPNLILHFK